MSLKENDYVLDEMRDAMAELQIEANQISDKIFTIDSLIKEQLEQVNYLLERKTKLVEKLLKINQHI